MNQLLTLGWPFFAGAGALGALIGFLATSREKNAAAAPGWVLIALVATLCVSAAASAAGVFSGREAMMFDVALLAGAAYVGGLPLGRALKLMGAETAPETKRATQSARPIVVPTVKMASPDAPLAAASTQIVAPPALETKSLAPAMQSMPDVVASVDASDIDASDIDASDMDAAALAAKALGEKVAQMRAPASAKNSGKNSGSSAEKSHPGARPSTLAAARGGSPDDLSRIKGVGPKSVEKLHGLGIFHYDQIAGWNADNAKWMGAAMGFAGRVERDDWIAQARKLSAGKAHNAA